MAFLKGQHSFQPVVRICNRKMITTRYATFCDYVTSTIHILIPRVVFIMLNAASTKFKSQTIATLLLLHISNVMWMFSFYSFFIIT